MKNELHKRIESTFRNSTSQDELFDAFGEAVKNEIHDFELYKILLANPFLSIDEIKMYSSKLLKELPLDSYQICMWTAKIFESHSMDFTGLDDTINYYERANQLKPQEFEPLLSLLKLYNNDVETENNNKIFTIIKERIKNVVLKSKVYYSLADHFKKLGDTATASRYLALAEKSIENERG